MRLFYSLCFIFVLLHNFSKVTITAAAAVNAVTPAISTDYILLNCGASFNLNDTGRRTWDIDNISSHLASTAFNLHHSVSEVPYEVASFFLSPHTYTFSLQTAATVFLRLHFYPGIYSNFNTSQSFFSVTANAFTLFSNFSAYLYSKNSSQPSFMKEFVIKIGENKSLDVTFFPSPNSFAFINGIEIVPMPDTLYFRGNDAPNKSVDQLYYHQNGTALENLYRLNVGGASIAIQEDSGHVYRPNLYRPNLYSIENLYRPNRSMFRAWSPDDDYIFGADYGYAPYRMGVSIKYTTTTPSYSAPHIVYTTARIMANYSTSLEWAFPVDSGFYYLLRLHFCEFMQEVTKLNEVVFTISINNEIAEIAADVLAWAGKEVPIFKDYLTKVPDDGRRGKQDLRLSLKPNTETIPLYESALLNGLEIFKLSDPDGSLAAANPEDTMDSTPTAVAIEPTGRIQSRGSSKIYTVIGSAIGVAAVVVTVSFLIFRSWRKKVKAPATTSSSWVLLSGAPRSTKTSSGSGASLPANICRYFSLDEIKTATRNFNDDFIIGRGGFGKVYKGLIDDATTTVAIKRLNPASNQGAREFLTEIKILSKLRHLNLVWLIGYCADYGEMILVYDYMAHGTLRSHLYNSETPPLTWNQRLRVCIGAAKGLHYLHTGTEQAIIHRDVKTTNILLDEKWVAKISDFGLSREGGAHTHVSTAIKGSIGYVDPEYCSRQQLTVKSDVYSFGVVLFEVLCARPAILPDLPREKVNLAEWAKFCFMEGILEQILDSDLKGQIAAECLSKFAETAAACVSDKGIDRPAMSDVVRSLELAMRLQQEVESGGGSLTDGDGGSSIAHSVESHSSNFEMVSV